jgi:hypothetical protein
VVGHVSPHGVDVRAARSRKFVDPGQIAVAARKQDTYQVVVKVVVVKVD